MSATYRRTRYSVASLSLALALILSALLVAVPPPAQAVSPNVVISQVYGGGGNSGATYKNDFVELYNLSTTAVDRDRMVSTVRVLSRRLPGKRRLYPGHPARPLLSRPRGCRARRHRALPTPDAPGIHRHDRDGRQSGSGQQPDYAHGGTSPYRQQRWWTWSVGSAANCSETSPTGQLEQHQPPRCANRTVPRIPITTAPTSSLVRRTRAIVPSHSRPSARPTPAVVSRATRPS